MSVRKDIVMDLTNVHEFPVAHLSMLPVPPAALGEVFYWHDGRIRPLADWTPYAFKAAWQAYGRRLVTCYRRRRDGRACGRCSLRLARRNRR